MSGTSLMDLCMKEFAMQQKLGMEFHLQQQQQNLMPSPSPFSPFNFGPYSPVTDIPSSSSASSSFFPPQQFTKLNQPQQSNKNHSSILFDKKSSFVQECPPPTLFDPYAASVAANFMQHFSKPKFDPQQSQMMPQMWNNGIGVGGWPMMMGDGPMTNNNIHSASFPNSAFGFGFPQLPDSPSNCCASLNSTGSCASLDSFGSSCLPSSPDSSSNCSLQNGGPPFPLIGAAGAFRKLTSNQNQNGLICWPSMESASSTLMGTAAPGNGNGLRLGMGSNMATDFSELLATNAFKNAPQKGIPQSGVEQKQSQILRHENEVDEGKKTTKAPTPWMGSTITVQHAQQFMHKNSATAKKRPLANEKKQQQPKKSTVEHFGQRKPSILLTDNEEVPPKKMARKLGTTIFVPLEMSKGKKGIMVAQKESKNAVNSLGQPPTLIPAMELAEMGKNEAKETATKGNGKLENGDECMKPFCEQQQEEAPLLEVNLGRLKCEFIELEEAKFLQQNGQNNAENEAAMDASFLLADSPPILTLEKENGGEKRAKKEVGKKQKRMTNLDEKKIIRKLKKRTIKKLTKIDEQRIDELNEKIKEKMKDENAMKNEEIGVKNDGGEEAEKKMKEPFKLEDLESSSSSSICPFVGLDDEQQNESERKAENCEKMEENEMEEEVEDEEEGGIVEDEEEEEKERKVACRWTNCKEKFEDDDQLYDHMTTAHVELLKKWVLAEQRELEQQKKAGLKRRRSSGGGNGTTSTAKERFRCRWRKCEQFPRRGDAQKKLDWLLKHLVIRHAPKARPYCCIFAGCPLRFPKLETLRDHLRTAHDDTNGKGNGRKSGGTANGGGEDGRTKINCLEFRPRVHLPIVRDCIDARTGEWIRSRLNGEQFAAFSDEPELLTNLVVNLNGRNTVERAKSRKMRNRISSQQNNELKLCKTMEIGDGRILGVKVESNDNADHLLSSRMSLHDTVNHLKGIFQKMSMRR